MALAYLLDPSFQTLDENGRPLVGGHIEVYYHNTSTKYVTKADFEGTNNPFKVPLNSKGMAVIIASDQLAYDVFCYDRFGALYWSRQNVNTIGGSGGGGGGMAPSLLIAQKWGTHYVSGTDAGTDPLTDGIFLFQEKEKLGEDIWVDESDHKIYCKKGWYHFDFQVFFFVNKIPYSYNGGTQPRIDSVQVNAGGSGDSLLVDLDRGTTDTYTTTAQFGADIYASFDGFNISATIKGLGYNSYAHVGLMAIHKIAEDE